MCVCLRVNKVCWGKSIEYPTFSFNFSGFYNACDFARVLYLNVCCVTSFVSDSLQLCGL